MVTEMTTEATPVVLVADDEPGMLALVGQHIKTMGYKVLEASDGEQAWALAQEHLPDLVILDVMMPGMSGWEVCRKIREDVALAHTAIIMLTGIGENLNELTSPLYGADSYIDKPFAFPELDDKVRGALIKRRGSRPGLARTEPDEVHENGGSGHPLLSSEGEDDTVEVHDPDMDASWDEEQPEIRQRRRRIDHDRADDGLARPEHTAPQAGVRKKPAPRAKAKGRRAHRPSRRVPKRDRLPPPGQARSCEGAPKQARQRQRGRLSSAAQGQSEVRSPR